ncbi:MAG: ATP-dependent zinc metalloprotease FtsH [Lachnospiraceae bacterium]|nr:ATP-dependent zinc metalloprotease FtsH [Lachnospiraceae bacterium]
MNSKRSGGGLSFLILIGILVVWYLFAVFFGSRSSNYTYAQFQNDLENNRITSIFVGQNKEVPTGYITIKNIAKESMTFYVSDVNAAIEFINEKGYNYTLGDVERDNIFLTIILPIMVGVIIIIFIFLLFSVNAGGSGNAANSKLMNFGKSRARMLDPSKNKITFKDVAGLAEEKEEMEEIVDFLRTPEKYANLGARIPKGIILVGPPGTGKTLLAKAIAGEAGVPFFSISGSDFVEMFVGVGASRVRDLFEEAKKNAPCMIFIDEIDAVARRRGTGMGGGHDEREQTLNQMLVEMDGFGANEGIIVLAATNRVDILDPAILRPGRFDRKIAVGRPDVRGRREILEVHAKNKPLGEDVNLDEIAQTTAGFTGADLENLLNESAILAAKQNRAYIIQEDINRSFIKLGIGTEKKSRIISEKEKKITAYHESGHAILFHVLSEVGPVHTVSIIPTGTGAAGYTMPLPERDEMFNTRGKMLQSIMVSLGGRIAEELTFDDITTGASQDIKQATGLAKAMIKKYGMSSRLGLVCYDDDDDEVFIGRDLAHTKSYAEKTAATIDEEVQDIVNDCYAKAKEIILQYRDVLEKSAKLLIEKEKIGRDEFEELFEKSYNL